MNRKNTILIAILINAGLLCVLLIAALATQEEEALPSSYLGESEKPLFGDAADLALRQPAPLPLQPKEIPLALPEIVQSPEVQLPPQTPFKAAEPQMVHQIPQMAPEPIAAPPAPVHTPVAAASPFQEVTVKKGDSLEKIAKAHKTTVDDIIKFNQLPSSFLRVGQILKIPAEKSLASAPKPKPAPAPEKKEGGQEYYIVKVGDNPWTIAMKHHMKVEELLKLNGLNEERARKLKPGDRLRTR